MTTISMSRKDAGDILEFCTQNNRSEFFFAKDSGAYFGATAGDAKDGSFRNCIRYVNGCDPSKDIDWYNEATGRFGGDDFGIHFPVHWLEVFMTHPALQWKRKFSIKVTAGSAKMVLK